MSGECRSGCAAPMRLLSIGSCFSRRRLCITLDPGSTVNRSGCARYRTRHIHSSTSTTALTKRASCKSYSTRYTASTGTSRSIRSTFRRRRCDHAGGQHVSVRLSRLAIVEYFCVFQYSGGCFIWRSALYGDIVSMSARLSMLHDDVGWRSPVRTQRLAVAGWRLRGRHREELFFRYFLFCACLVVLGAALFVHV